MRYGRVTLTVAPALLSLGVPAGTALRLLIAPTGVSNLTTTTIRGAVWRATSLASVT